MVEITATEQNIERRMKRNEDSLRDLWDSIKYMIIHIIWVPEGEEREKGAEKIFKDIIAEDFLNMGKEIINQVQEAQRVSGRVNPRRNTLKHIVIKSDEREEPKAKNTSKTPSNLMEKSKALQRSKT